MTQRPVSWWLPGLILSLVLFFLVTPRAQQWSERGPVIGGRLSAIVATDGGRTLIASSPGGGVWRSTDGGKLWTFPANEGAADLSFVHLEWDLANPHRLFGLTWNALYASTDRANSWATLVNAGGTPVPLSPEQSSIADPRPFAQLRLSVNHRAVVTALPCSGLYYSLDGVRFTQHWPFPNGAKNLDNCIGTIVADQVSRRVYFSTLKQGRPPRVFRSDCGGATWQAGQPCLTWQPANAGLPANGVVSAMVSVSEPGSGDRLVAQLSGAGSSLETWLTTDGQTWTKQSGQPRAWSPRALVHLGSGASLVEGFVGLSYSPDLGKTWQSIIPRTAHPDFRGICADERAGKLWAVNDGSMSGTYANIMRWDWRPGQAPSGGVDLGHKGLSVWQAYYAAVVPHGTGRRVFIGAQDNASLCADDVSGANWLDDGGAPAGGDGFIFQVAPSNPNRAYAWANDPGHFVRTDNAASAASCKAVIWTTVAPRNDPPKSQMMGADYWTHHNMAVHPRDPGRVYFALTYGIGVAVNAGEASPRVVHRDLSHGVRATVVHVDASGAVYVGTKDHGVFRSTDDGVTWAPWGLNDDGPAFVTAIAGGGGRSATYWAATTDGLFRREARGGAWTRVTGAAGRVVSDVVVDPSCASRVYAGYGFAATQGQQPGGIEVSWDTGATWKSITAGEILDRVPITSIQVDPKQPQKVYVATYGRGFWGLDWGTKLPPCRGAAAPRTEKTPR
jgi:hypothetical protein